MGYLIPKDYKKTIQRENLNQVINDDPEILTDAEDTAVEKASTLLVQKYQLGREFQGTPKWVKTQVYLAFNRVYLDAPVYSATATYAAGDYVTYLAPGEKNYGVYKSIAGNAPGAFNATQWTYMNSQYAIYNAAPPKPEFNYQTTYKIGDQVFWKNKTYTCAVPSSAVAQSVAIQYLTYQNIPFGNVFP